MQALQDAWEQAYAALPQSMLAAALTEAALLKEVIESNLTGNVLNARSGRLQQALVLEAEGNAAQVNVQIGVSDDVPYAAILEYGGQTKAHIIQTSNAKMLAFMGQGKTVFCQQVQLPGAVIPAFAYMGKGLVTQRESIVSSMSAAVDEALTPVASGGIS